MSSVTIVTIDEPAGKAWTKAALKNILAVPGVKSAAVDATMPSRITCSVPNGADTKSIINKVAYTLPGVPLKWTSTDVEA